MVYTIQIIFGDIAYCFLIKSKMPPNKKRKIEKNRQRRHRSTLKSHSVTFTAEFRFLRRKFEKILQEGCKQIRDNDFTDHLKFVRGTQQVAKSAKLSTASFNIYYGGDVVGSVRTIDGVETVERYAYASGTANSTIGLDNQTRTYKPLPAFFDMLKAAIKDLPDHLLDRKYKVDYNTMSVKVYYKIPGGSHTKTGWHADVLYNHDNEPAAGNSQVPGTPVLLFTCGGQKEIVFGKTPGGSKNIIESTVHSHRQSANGFFVLDPRDEMWKNGLKWMHFSKHPKSENGMSVHRVKVADSTFHDKGEDDPHYSSIRETYQLDEEYLRKVAIIDDQMDALCHKKIY